MRNCAVLAADTDEKRNKLRDELDELVKKLLPGSIKTRKQFCCGEEKPLGGKGAFCWNCIEQNGGCRVPAKHNFFKSVIEMGAEIVKDLPGTMLRKPSELGKLHKTLEYRILDENAFKAFLVKFSFASEDAADLAKLVKFVDGAYFARSLQDPPSTTEIAQFVARMNQLLA